MVDLHPVEIEGDEVMLPLIPDFTPDWPRRDVYCAEPGPNGGYGCTLDKGHESPWCVAGSVERVVALWRTRK